MTPREFLARVEQKNAALTTLVAEFEQVREDPLWMDTVRSTGKFWYQSPGLFRASYKSENDTEIWITPDRMVTYTPAIKQVDILGIPQGDKAPINQLLLGFGVKVAEIEKIFTMQPADPAEPGDYSIRFNSRDLSRSLQFRTITIHFNPATLEPRVLVLEDDQSVITMTLRRVQQNIAVDPALFEQRWPAGTEVIDHRQ
jgi:outer membrane lipoprotein-sorting protein